MGDGAFLQCLGLTGVSIPSGVTNIGNQAFEFCNALGGISIPASVASLGSNAFLNCASLTSITIPAGVQSIGLNAFFDCASLGSAVISPGVTSLGCGMFEGCSHLASLTIPGSVTNLGRAALADCPALDRVIYIGNAPIADASVFAGDTLATNYYLPGTTGWSPPFAGAVTVLWIPFNYTTSAGNITITGYTGPGQAVTIPATINGLPVTSVGSQAFFNNSGSITSLTIPGGVTNISANAFLGCYHLASVSIAGSVIAIGNSAFSGCYSLTNVILLSGVKIIGDNAFYLCNGLNNVALGNGVTSIGSKAFYADDLTNITIPGSVTNFGNNVFAQNTNLNGIYFSGNAPSVGSSIFAGDPNATVYYLPGTTGWSNVFANVPALPWTPQIQTSDGRFGVQSKQFGFNLNWASGKVIEVDVCTNLVSPDWMPLQTVTLTNGNFYFSEPLDVGRSSRYYRLASP